MKRLPVILAAAALTAATLGVVSVGSSVPGIAATAPPGPPDPRTIVTPLPSATIPAGATPTPIPLFTVGGKSPAPSASPSASPAAPKDNRVGYEGVWEVQLQNGATTTYTHFVLHQTANTLTGTYLDDAKKKYPLAGSVDGSHMRIVVSMPDGTTQVFDANVQGTTDMLGVVTNGDTHFYFTAAYRPKESWMDNINAAPGGLGGAGGGYPGGGNPTQPH